MAFKSQVHVEPYQYYNGDGHLIEWVEMHTYDLDAVEPMALVNVSGSNTEHSSQNIDLWLTEAEVRAIRDGLNSLLDEPKEEAK